MIPEALDLKQFTKTDLSMSPAVLQKSSIRVCRPAVECGRSIAKFVIKQTLPLLSLSDLNPWIGSAPHSVY